MISLQSSDLKIILTSIEFQAVDTILAETLESEFGETNSWIHLAGAMVSMLVRQGHAYLDLASPEHYLRLSNALPLAWPSSDEWKQFLANSNCCTSNSEYLPLVLEQGNRLYLQRYFDHEESVAKSISALTAKTLATETSSAFSEDAPKDLHPKQIEAIEGALKNRFFVLTGGPGTGKTTTVLHYLVAQLLQTPNPNLVRIAIAAPTGKAAARLSESILSSIHKLDLPKNIQETILEIPCQTIHRLLGTRSGLNSFRHSKQNPLAFDILIIDEASMIDLPLMRRLLDALSPDTNLLLLGDQHQLNSVSVGSVFKDLLDASQLPSSPLANSICQLTKTYRFDESSGIFHLCNTIRSGKTNTFLETINNNPYHDLTIHLSDESDSHFISLVNSGFDHWKHICKSDSLETALSRLTDKITLLPLRRGRQGTEDLNQSIKRKILDGGGASESDELFHGLPIIVLENNYDSELYNGDLGLIWEIDGKLKACFSNTDGVDIRQFPISSLPRHEAAFALSIHKSQGSEFSHVSIFLSERHEAHLSKELIYTAFSRARDTLEIRGDKLALIKGLSTQVKRATGLNDKLGNPN
ncbi:exodeoxyribonuclease V subunit alpha [Puniceicoccaceae bacterium K14]|nr:exodeoxyribonuclease V subunit alpha [Puniceicoccaceae bacterium K14]